MTTAESQRLMLPSQKRLVLAGLASVACAAVFVALSINSPQRFFRTNLGLLQASAPVSYYIHDGAGTPGYAPADRELAELALQAWERESGGKLRFVPAETESAALLRVRWVAGQGGFGEMQRIYVDGKPGAVVFISAATETLGEPLSGMASRDSLLRDTIVYLTCVHEIGHAVGLPHTTDFDDIMYSFGYGGDLAEYFSRYRRKLASRADIRLHSGLSPGDISTLRSLY